MPKIVLIRHVTPIVDFTGCSAHEAQRRLNLYHQTDKLHLEETAMFQRFEYYQDSLNIQRIFVSPLIRAQKTAEKLFPAKTFETLNELREFDLKIVSLPKLKCSLNAWFALSRILWFFNLNQTENTRNQEIRRIRQIMPVLFTEDCIIVTHGCIIHEIKKELKKQYFTHLFHQKQGCFTVDIFNKHEGKKYE